MTTLTTEQPIPAARVPEPPAPPEDATLVQAGVEEQAETVGAPAGNDIPDAVPALRDMPGLLWPVVVVAVVGGAIASGVGFALSYRTLMHAAVVWGFGRWGSVAFPSVIDGAIVSLYAFDLILTYRKMSKPLLRGAAHLLTAVTIMLNVIAAAGSASLGVVDALGAQPGRLIAHGAAPLVFVLVVEGVRHLITRTARLEAGADDDRLTLADWALRPRSTWEVFREAKTWPCSYSQARQFARRRAIHRVWIAHREEIEAGLEEGRVGTLDRLPDLLAAYGVSVEEALALPDRMRDEEEQRRADRERADRARERAAERESAAAAHADKLAALAAEAEALRAAGQVDVLRSEVEGERRSAAHRAAAAADTAGIEAAAQRSTAERLATAEERRLAAEEEAEENARTAALNRKAAEDKRATARAAEEAARAAETAARTALTAETQRAEAQRIAAATARAEREAADVQRRAEEESTLATARAAEEVAAAELRTAQTREAASLAALRATAAEDALGLSDRERRLRRVAWMISTRAEGNALMLPLSEIETALDVQNGAASTYRRDAAELIASGYDHRTDPLHGIYRELPQQDGGTYRQE